MATFTASNLSAGRDVRVIVSDSIQNSFNRIDKWQADPNLKGEVQQLIQQVTEVTARLNQDGKADKSRELEQKLDSFTEEVVSAKRPFYSVTAKGLKEAAEAVGGIAAPVVATVTKILSLLAVAA